MPQHFDSWFDNLKQPPFQPPGWLFGPVWTILYTLMGIAFFMILKTEGENKTRALIIFGIQLFFNFLWTYFFFQINNLRFSLIDILILYAFVVWTIIEFYRLNKTAGLLLIPYILWLTLATTLNVSLIILNPEIK